MDLRRQRALFDAALALPERERADWLRRECPDDAARAQVERLLAAHESIEEDDAGFLVSARPPELPPERIGHYFLLEPLGEGGMGEVHLAEQLEPVRRRVAIKLLRAGFAGRDMMARFDVERQTLALLDHPNVARILDAGVTSEGRPYVVVEHVPGQPITRYSDQRRLGIAERLDLFLDVCAGVQHAHQRGIIHRDLKPSNVLVAEVDRQATPKIIDFDIAKALRPLPTGSGPLTMAGQIVGTPDYMSPEQAELSPLAVDTRADVYSLGVILCELLCGQLPYESVDTSAGALRVAQDIATREATRPSQRLARDPAQLARAAHDRSTTPRALRAALAGDLDWIVLKSLERDLQRRYGSAAELASDIRRYRRSQPVRARAPDSLYLARRFLRRNRYGVAVGAFLASLLVALGVLMQRQASETARERDRATAEAQTANQVSNFLIETFRAADPERHHGQEMTARQQLDDAAERLDRELAGEPAAKARLEMAIGDIYFNLGEFGRADRHFRHALAMYETLQPPDDHGRLAALRQVGRTATQLGQLETGEQLTLRTLAEVRTLFGERDALHVDATHDLGALRNAQGRYREALTLFQQAAQGRERVYGEADELTTIAHTNVAVVQQLLGNTAEAERAYLAILDRLEARGDPDNTQLLTARLNLSTLYAGLGDYRRAVDLQRQVLPAMRRVYGEDHPFTLQATGNLASSLSSLGRHRESYEENRKLVERLLRVQGANALLTLYTRANLAYEAGVLGQRDAAETSLRDVIDKQLQLSGPQHRNTIISETLLGRLLVQWNRRQAAIPLFESALVGSRAGLGTSHPTTQDLLLRLADNAYALGDETSAANWLRQARLAGVDLKSRFADYPEIARRQLAGQLPR
jgi:non-specific serine/threonine protein kinase/serine/threonine-protein kinase